MLHRSSLVLLSLLLALTARPARALPDSLRGFIDTALTVMQTRSLYGKDLDWPAIRAATYARAAAATSRPATLPALAVAFDALRDPHGLVAVLRPDSAHHYRDPGYDDGSKRLSEGIKREYAKGPRIRTAQLPDGVAYLKVPAMIGPDEATATRWVRALRDSLCVLLARHPRGLVLDLRMNNGGNSAPMQAGLAPLFAPGTFGYGVDRDGRRLDSMQTAAPLRLSPRACAARVTLPLAVLVGPATASSGEILAIIARQQPGARTFGEPTAGFCNATEGFVFGGGRGYLLLAVNYVADAGGRVYRKGRVTPDVYIKSADDYDHLTTDPTVTAARQWLAGQPAAAKARRGKK